MGCIHPDARLFSLQDCKREPVVKMCTNPWFRVNTHLGVASQSVGHKFIEDVHVQSFGVCMQGESVFGK